MVDQEIEMLVADIVINATERHQANSIYYWNGLRSVIEWWESLPNNLQQDIEGSGREPWAIVKARKLIHPNYKAV